VVREHLGPACERPPVDALARPEARATNRLAEPDPATCGRGSGRSHRSTRPRRALLPAELQAQLGAASGDLATAATIYYEIGARAEERRRACA